MYIMSKSTDGEREKLLARIEWLPLTSCSYISHLRWTNVRLVYWRGSSYYLWLPRVKRILWIAVHKVTAQCAVMSLRGRLHMRLCESHLRGPACRGRSMSNGVMRDDPAYLITILIIVECKTYIASNKFTVASINLIK